MPKIPKYKGPKSFLTVRKRTITIITKIIFLRKGCLMKTPFNVSWTVTDTQPKLWLKAYISRKLFARFFSFQEVRQGVPYSGFIQNNKLKDLFRDTLSIVET
mgnify:CR=1 FL=1